MAGNRQNFLRNQAVMILLIVLVAALAILSPSFRNTRNLLNIIRKISILGIVTCGLTLPIVSGGLDLSVGSVFSLVGALAIMWQPHGLAFAIVGSLGIACLVGLADGLILHKFNVSPIIVTLGMLSIIQGLTLVITKSRNQLGDLKSPYSLIANGAFLGINNQVAIFLLIAILLYLILQRSTFGRYIYLLGSNQEAARHAGIRIGSKLIVVYMISALSAGLAAIVLSSRMSGAQPYAGQGLEFDAITAALIGGNSIGGGRGSIYNTIVGVLLVSVLINGMILLNIPYPFQIVMKGCLILIAVVTDVRTRSREYAV